MTKLFLQETIRVFLNVQLDKSFKGDFFARLLWLLIIA